MTYQPLIDAAAGILAFWMWPYLIALWIFAIIVERNATLARWIEALGWDGLRELLAGFGNSPSSLMRARVDALDASPVTTTVTPMVRP